MTTLGRCCKIMTLWLGLVLSLNAAAQDKFKVAILMFDNVQIIDFAGPYEVFGQARFEVITVSKDGEPVETVMGLNVAPSHSFATMPAVDAVIVPGGNVHDAMQDNDIQKWLNSQQKTAAHILSVCTGSHILAEAGLLDGKGATTFHRSINWLKNDYPQIDVQPKKRFVDNGQIITSAGLSSGIDASLHLVGKVLGLDRAKTIALHIEYDWDPDGGFVRALMADKQFPDNQYDWPEGVNFNRTSSFGDEAFWQTTYQVTTDIPIKNLIAAYQKAMSVHDDWRMTETDLTNQLNWQGLGKNLNWNHQLTIVETDLADTFKLQVTVKKES